MLAAVVVVDQDGVKALGPQAFDIFGLAGSGDHLPAARTQPMRRRGPDARGTPGDENALAPSRRPPVPVHCRLPRAAAGARAIAKRAPVSAPPPSRCPAASGPRPP